MSKHKPKTMSIGEHHIIANDLAIACHHIEKIYQKLMKKYPKSHRVNRLFRKIAPNYIDGIMIQIKGELDELWQNDTKHLSASEFRAVGGFIHYHLEERYKKNKIMEEKNYNSGGPIIIGVGKVETQRATTNAFI